MIAAIVQARMGARRLPGKVLRTVNGIPLLSLQQSRLSRSRLLQKVVIATTLASQDDRLADFCVRNGFVCFRGEEHDVLSRYYECARNHGVDTIVRITADCPMVDPEVVDQTIDLFLREKADFAANTVPPPTSRFPDGSDVEVFSFQALERAHRECRNTHDREHVTFYFWKYNNGFKTVQLLSTNDFSKYRFTVDYPEDLAVLEDLCRELAARKKFGHLKEIVEILEANPQIRKKNAQYYFGIGWKQ